MLSPQALLTSALLVTCFQFLSVTCQAKGGENFIRLPALGRSARLGTLYNARTEELTGVSILRGLIPSHLKTTAGNPGTNTRYGVVKSYSDKRALLDVSASLTLSFLGGFVSVTGAARYLSDEKSKSNSVVGSLLYEATTYEDHLEIFYEEMRSHISLDVLANATETHVVIGQGYGSNVLVKFEDVNTENEVVSQVEARMGASLDILGFGISVDAEVDIGETNLDVFSNYSIEVFGDVGLDTQDYPTNVTDVVKLLEKVPSLVSKSNEGRGKQLFFYLLPLDTLRDFLQDQGQNKSESCKVKGGQRALSTNAEEELPSNETSLQLDVFQEISVVQLKLTDLYRSMMNNRDILNNTDLYSVQVLKNSFKNLTTTYRSKVHKNFVGFRASRSLADRQRRLKVMNELMQEEESYIELVENSIDNDYKEARLKIELVDLLRSQGGGVIWVGRSDSVATSAINLFRQLGTANTTICTIHFHRIYLRNTILFVSAVMEATRKNWTAFVVDCDFDKESCQLDSSQERTCQVIFTPPKGLGQGQGSRVIKGQENSLTNKNSVDPHDSKCSLNSFSEKCQKNSKTSKSTKNVFMNNFLKAIIPLK